MFNFKKTKTKVSIQTAKMVSAAVAVGSVHIYIYFFFYSLSGLHARDMRLWKVARFSVCKLINYGYCQDNVRTTCYNEYSETHQRRPTGCHSIRLMPPSLPEISPFLPPPTLSRRLCSICSISSLIFFFFFCCLYTFFFQDTFSFFFLNLKASGNSWEFLDGGKKKQSRVEFASKKNQKNAPVILSN